MGRAVCLSVFRAPGVPHTSEEGRYQCKYSALCKLSLPQDETPSRLLGWGSDWKVMELGAALFGKGTFVSPWAFSDGQGKVHLGGCLREGQPFSPPASCVGSLSTPGSSFLSPGQLAESPPSTCTGLEWLASLQISLPRIPMTKWSGT